MLSGHVPSRWTVLAAVVLVTASRAPLLLLEPRLIAEEASVYLVYARDHGVLPSLLLVPTSEGPAGYLHLAANLAAVLEARLFALEHAAAVSTAIAYLLQLVPFALVLWGRSVAWNTDRRRLLCCLLLLFAPAVSPAVWLSTINSQVFCGVSSLLLLLEDLSFAGRRRKWLYRCLLVFNGLSGPYTALLAPGVLWRSVRQRSREAWIQTALVCAAVALQGFVYLATALGSELAPDRLTPLHPATAASSVLVFHVLGAFLGNELADLVGSSFGLAVQPDLSVPTGSIPLAALAAITAGVLLWGAGLLRERRTDTMTTLAIVFASLSTSLSILAHGLPWRRYAVVPGVVLLLAMLVGSWEAAPTLRRAACRTLIAVALVFGVGTFWRDAPMLVEDFSVTNFGNAPGRPDWREEVAAWRNDPTHELRVWPFAGERSWKAYLPRPGDFQRVRLEPEGNWRLIFFGKAVERRVLIVDAPGDFRVHVSGTASTDLAGMELLLRLTTGGPEPATLARRRILSLSAGRRFDAILTPSYLRQEVAGAENGQRWVVLSVQGPLEKRARIVVDRIAVVPRVRSLLDRWGFDTSAGAAPGGTRTRPR